MSNINKKILIISGIIALTVISFLAFYFLKSGSVWKKIIPAVKNEEIIERTVEEKKQDFEKLKTENPNKIIKTINKIEAENCARVTDKDLQKICYDFIKFNEALEKNDIAVCDSLETGLKDSCLFQIIAGGGEDFSACAEIVSISLRDLCYQAGAVAQNNQADCDKLETGKERCREAVISAWSYLGEIAVCAPLEIPEYFSFCVKNNKKDCADIGSEELIKKCETWRNFDYVTSLGDKTYCDILPLENFKIICQKYFDNEKKYSDTDVDGANDWEELYFGFDPLTPEEGIMEKIAEIKKTASADDVYADYQAKLYRLMLDLDADGLRDYEEDIYKTDINNPDTDSDGYPDGDEVKGGFNPNGENKL